MTDRASERPALVDRLAEWTYQVLIVAGVAAAVLLLWRLSDVLLLAFGGIVLSVALRALADVVESWTPLSKAWALFVSILLIVIVLTLTGWLLGGRIADQFGQLWQRLPETVDTVQNAIHNSPVGQFLPDIGALAGSQSGGLQRLTSLTSTTLGGLGNTIVMLVIGLYLSVDPASYRRGLVTLVPPSGRARFDAALGATGEALRKWLLGKVIAMAAVAVLTSLSLWLLDVPLALSLGFIAGLLDFVPMVGPIIAAIPAVLVAFSHQPIAALYVALLYLAVQQIEGSLISPIVQRQTVEVPPMLLIFAVVGFGVVFGFLGMIFGAPLMVVAMIFVKKLYIEGVLEKANSS